MGRAGMLPSEGSATKRWPPSDVSWARSAPARLARRVLLGGLVLPVWAFVNPVSVAGRVRLRGVGPALFVANHQSHLDVFACLRAVGGRRRRRLLVAAAADYFYASRPRGLVLSLAIGSIPFVRRDGSSRESLELAKRLLAQGWSVLLFPSGTRGGEELRPGFSYIAVDAGVPVVPIYLHGPEHAMPKGSLAPLPGAVAAVIGEPLTPGDDYLDLVRRTRLAFDVLRAEHGPA